MADFDSVKEFDKGIIIKNVKNFELNHIFDCGQCFRWHKEENGNYIGVAFNKVLEIEKKDNDIIIYNTNEDEFNKIWVEYFDLNRDYGKIKKILSKDPLLKIAVEYGYGIRILKQDPFEIVVSFIISANNRIPMIKKTIENISKNLGNAIDYKGKTYYTFPSIEELHKASMEDIEACGAGFRAKYIYDTVDKIYKSQKYEYNKNYDLDFIKNQEDDICHSMLQNFSGIGPKVADCIMLFSMNKLSAFPVDVWVKRAMQHFYLAPDVSLKKIREFARNKFGGFSGFAQQYLFYYARENNIHV
ncbi:N-glycosylase/DNA lyase [Clostridium sp. USBA 49]|jgi:N-glycosylase/DNA lyase|uniref:DNA-3-methyladenine glycosylase family protein n=1 Tax=Clostridium TaxID=1485 RepID=UPI00099B0EDB|nr:MULTISPECIES: DNA-3-methyladenine glycosylase [Clostridium]SKA80419.1 N-glycosylase/DNA lyase [Clostridium sp. USBA 49]